jgi:hypothetical protein
MLAEVGRYHLRRRETPQAMVPGLNLDGLPADLMAQIQVMIARQMAPARPGGSRQIDRDARGYANF